MLFILLIKIVVTGNVGRFDGTDAPPGGQRCESVPASQAGRGTVSFPGRRPPYRQYRYAASPPRRMQSNSPYSVSGQRVTGQSQRVVRIPEIPDFLRAAGLLGAIAGEVSSTALHCDRRQTRSLKSGDMRRSEQELTKYSSSL